MDTTSCPDCGAPAEVLVVTLPVWDVLDFKPPPNVRGVLAAPPCDHFSVSGAQYWKAKDADGRTAKALDVVDACLRIIQECRPAWWALENPVGRLRAILNDWGTATPMRYRGLDGLEEPRLIFDPCDYGDPWTKKTLLWGTFSVPETCRVEPVRACAQGSWLQKLGGKSEKTKRLRSATPPGFARAFFEANP